MSGLEHTVKIGESYMVKPAFLTRTCGGSDTEVLKGRVVYVHPKGRFAVLEFRGFHGTARECFWPDELTEENQRKQ